MTQPTRTASVGAIMRANDLWFHPSRTGFLALVALTGPEDVPDSLDLSTPDVLASAVVPLTHRAEVVSAPLDVNLSPGWYAVAIGSNYLGATADWRLPFWRDDPMDYAAAQRITMYSEDNGWAATPYIPHVFVVDAAFQAGVLSNDTDADGDHLAAQLVEPPAVGTLDFHPNGTFVFAPPAGFEGMATFHYQVADSWRTSETVMATIEVTDTPHVPIAEADTYLLDEDTELAVMPAEGAPGE